MIEEQGRVVSLEGDFAWIETLRTSACGSCSVNKGCGTGVISKYFAARFSRVKAVNQINARVNDSVVIGLEEQALVRGSFAVYVVPLLFMFLLAVIGEFAAQELGVKYGDGMAALFGLAGLASGFLWVRKFSKEISVDERYQPIVVRKGNGAECGKESPVRFDG
ncbi:SoxR reducing system RseC family protein [Pseudomonadota bacterium]